MSWRTVVVSSRCKLDMKMGYVVVRGEDTRRIFIDEIAILIIENPAVSITGSLLEALVEHKVRVIICDNHHLPAAELTPCYGSHDCVRKVKAQIAWTDKVKADMWKTIVSDKILQQARLLSEAHHKAEADQLLHFRDEVRPGDPTNREGHAARLYFSTLFGGDFTRGEESAINSALNYGYSVLMAATSREICACGYLTQLGIFHDNTFNPYNLSSDLMEPFRILVDRIVYRLQPEVFDREEKIAVLGFLAMQVDIRNSRQSVQNALGIYVHSVFEALENEAPELVKGYSFVEEE